MVRVKCMTYSTYRVLLTERDLQKIIYIHEKSQGTFSSAMQDVIKRGLTELTGDKPENRS